MKTTFKKHKKPPLWRSFLTLGGSLLITALFAVSACAQHHAPKKDWKKLGTASVDEGFTQVTLGSTYNIIKTADYGEIHLRHTDLDSLSLKKDSTAFKVFYPLKPEYSFLIDDIHHEGKNIRATFEIHLPNFSGSHKNTININLLHHPPKKSDQWIIRNYILPIIHDFLADATAKMHTGKSCIEQAMRACKKGNVKYLDISLFASGCSFECE